MLFDFAALERKAFPAEPTGAPEIPFYVEDLLPALQATLAALADLDIHRDIQQDCLEGWSGPDDVKRHLMAEVAVSWQSARKPLVQHLAQLHSRLGEAGERR
jgi:hypothetical protein